MPCNHKRVWETAEAILARLVGGDDMGHEPAWERDDSGRNKLLADSWEPYTVVANTMFFKRLKPCDECEKEMEARGKMMEQTMERMCEEQAERKRRFEELAQQKLKHLGIL